MSVESTVYGILTGYGPLTSLVGARVFPDVIGQNELFPSVAFTKSEVETAVDLLGNVQFQRNRITTQVWGTDKDSVELVMDNVVAAFAAAHIPLEARASTFDTDSGLYGASAEFDHWT